jgi:Chitobiase/beta-hexosaminidase C-terminal domain
MKRPFILLIVALLAGIAQAQSVFNCSSFVANTNTACGISLVGAGGDPFAYVGSGGTLPSVSSGRLYLMNNGNTHAVYAANYQAAVNVQAFSTTYTFIPNGWNVAFVLQNNTVTGAGAAGPNFFGGAGCEGAFYQAFGTGNIPPNAIFALDLTSTNYLSGQSSFQYSNAQIYQQTQSPCNPGDGGANYWSSNKVSTSPVPLNSPATTVDTTTGDTYSATVSYDGTNLSLCVYDVTAAVGSCSSSTSGTGTYFQQTWTAVDIPALVGSNTAYAGLMSSTNQSSTAPLYIPSWSYTVNSAPSTPSLSTYTTQSNAGSTPAANPTFSPAAGSYGGTQSVTISDATGSSYICYSLLTSLTSTTILPQPDNKGGCQSGTRYTSAVSVASTATLYAVGATTYTRLPSATVSAAYTITGGGSASTPTFTPGAGTYTGSQSVTLSTSSGGAIICYNTTGSPATNGSTGCTTGTLYTGAVSVSASETLYAVAGGTGYSDSTVGSAGYVISSSSSSARAVISGKTVITGKTVVQ